MVGLQQQRRAVVSDGSRYSSDEYVPPRQAWANGGRASPLNPATQASELPNTTSGHTRVNSGDNYFEDVDPRFAEQPPATNPLMPAALAPNYSNIGSSGNLHPIGGLDGNNSYEDIQQSGSRSPAESDRSNFTSVSQRGVNPRWGNGQHGAPMPRRPVQAQTQQRNDMLLNSNPDFQLPGGRGGRGGPGRGVRSPPGASASMTPGSAYPGL